MRAALLIASLQAAGATCPDRINFDGVELKQIDQGLYENNVGSVVLAQNPDDRTWMFLENEKLETLVSFDGDECVSNTKKWFKLESLQYSEKVITIEKIE